MQRPPYQPPTLSKKKSNARNIITCPKVNVQKHGNSKPEINRRSLSMDALHRYRPGSPIPVRKPGALPLIIPPRAGFPIQSPLSPRSPISSESPRVHARKELVSSSASTRSISAHSLPVVNPQLSNTVPKEAPAKYAPARQCFLPPKMPIDRSNPWNGIRKSDLSPQASASESSFVFGEPLESKVAWSVQQFVRAVGRLTMKDLLNDFDVIRKNVPTLARCKCWAMNPKKNRYPDVMCLDETRVVLKQPPGAPKGADYIHANFVSGKNLSNDFIITQAPLPNTVSDFWKLVWQEKSALIFQLCENVENNARKCSDYLPASNTSVLLYSGLAVTFVNRRSHNRGQLIETICQLVFESEKRTIIHWKWIGWPDYHVPNDDMSTPRRLLLMSRKANGPTIVHCSAGIGRSGSLVAIEFCLTDMAEGYPVSVKRNVEYLRSQRAQAVQSPEQYLFIHRALLDFAVVTKLASPADVELFVKRYNAHMLHANERKQ